MRERLIRIWRVMDNPKPWPEKTPGSGVDGAAVASMIGGLLALGFVIAVGVALVRLAF